MPSPQEEQLRLAPHTIEAEQALLGALMVHNEAYDRVSDFLRPEHFYEEIHARIYENAGKLIHAGKIATAITLKNFLPDQDLGGMTVAQYLVRLTQSATTIINAVINSVIAVVLYAALRPALKKAGFITAERA